MNVFAHEFKSYLRSALCWAVSLALLGLAIVLLFPLFAKDIEPFVQMLKSYPKEVLQALGIDQQSINSFNGFYSFMYVFVVLCAGVMGLSLGISVISKEKARKTADFLFTRPLSRVKVLLGKYFAVLALALLASLLYGATVYLAAERSVADFDRQTVLLFALAFLLTAALCVSIGFFVGCAAKKIKAPNAVAIALGTLFFALMMVDNLSEQNSIQFLSPLSYMSPRYIAAHRALDVPYLVALLAVAALLSALGILLYKTRDIHAA